MGKDSMVIQKIDKLIKIYLFLIFPLFIFYLAVPFGMAMIIPWGIGIIFIFFFSFFFIEDFFDAIYVYYSFFFIIFFFIFLMNLLLFYATGSNFSSFETEKYFYNFFLGVEIFNFKSLSKTSLYLFGFMFSFSFFLAFIFIGYKFLLRIERYIVKGEKIFSLNKDKNYFKRFFISLFCTVYAYSYIIFAPLQ